MKIYNTLTRNKEEFVPINEGEIGMYVCGPTVYNLFHIGNARTFIVFDSIRRYLIWRGYRVTFVQNFTDIDDKMIIKANNEGITVKELGDRYISDYYKDADSINIMRADYNPRATSYINKIIDFILKLQEKGYAYEIDGDVYFSKKDYGEYGKLFTQNQDDLMSGIRIDVDKRKKDPTDFALWKKKKDGEPFWESPWGDGRPGWHIECSVMSTDILGKTIDIHGGGIDLIFPHHENEIAQSEACNSQKFVNYWVHSAFVNVDNRKMAKSLNNFVTTRELAKEYGANPIRFIMLAGHYRIQIEYSEDLIKSAKSSFERIENAYFNLEYFSENNKIDSIYENDKMILLSEYENKFIEKMDNDFNTADAISVIFDMVKWINTNIDENSSKEFVINVKNKLEELINVLGFKIEGKTDVSVEIEKLIEERQQARANKDFKRADEIRDELKNNGIIIEDTPSGVKWKNA